MALIPGVGEELIEYQYKMCLYGQPSFLVPYELLILPEGYRYIYDEDIYEPIWSDVNAIMTADRLKELLSAVGGVIDDVREYLLELGQVQFDEGSVLENESGGICFIYRPFEVKSVADTLSYMTNWFVVLNRHADLNCERSMAMLHPLGIAIASESFDLAKFRELIRTTIGEQG